MRSSSFLQYGRFSPVTYVVEPRYGGSRWGTAMQTRGVQVNVWEFIILNC